MISDKHLWGFQRTVYRDKSVWVVEIFGKKGGASSMHCHKYMVNASYVKSGLLKLTDRLGWSEVLSPGNTTSFKQFDHHQLTFLEDTEGIETYYALPGHEIDENDIVRLSPGRAPDDAPA